MKPVKFSDHALIKLRILVVHGVKLDEGLIISAVTQPDRVLGGYRGRKIAEKGLDQEHILRVVYEQHAEQLLVVTFYPARRGRYDPN